MNLCLFDLDETLLPLDSDHAWGEFVIRLGWVDEAGVDAVRRLRHLDPLAAGPARAAVLGLSEQLGNELLDHANKFRMRQPRARAMASSSGDGLVATGSLAFSSSGRSLTESL